jgi:hypothetical protein
LIPADAGRLGGSNKALLSQHSFSMRNKKWKMENGKWKMENGK